MYIILYYYFHNFIICLILNRNCYQYVTFIHIGVNNTPINELEVVIIIIISSMF